MATVTIGLSHDEQGDYMENIECSRLALLWILQTELFQPTSNLRSVSANYKPNQL